MLAVLVLLAVLPIWSANATTYPAHKIKADGVESLEVVGVRGHLKLIGRSSKNFHIKVSHTDTRQTEDWHLLVERRGKKLVLEVANAVLGADWREHLKQDQWPQFDIELEGPALPATVSWREGVLTYVGWRSEVETSLMKGRITVAASQGKQSVQAVQADVKVTGFRGQLTVKGERGALFLDSVEGETQAIWLSGTLNARNTSGRVRVEGQDLTAFVSGQGGDWDMELQSGSVLVKNFLGHFTGRGQTTKWQVRGTPQSDVEVLNESGPVNIDWGSSPTRVFLTTTSGAIVSPFATQVLDGRIVSEGKRGRKPTGQLFVRTNSGPIHFK